MSTPFASRTTVSSRNKMAATGLHTHHNNHHRPQQASLASKTPLAGSSGGSSIATSSISRLAPRTAFKQPLSRTETANTNLAATSSRIALPRSRLSANTATPAPNAGVNPTRIPPTFASANRKPMTTSKTNGRTTPLLPPLGPVHGSRIAGPHAGEGPSFANSRSSSKLSSVSSSVTNHQSDVNSHPSSRQPSLATAQNLARQQHNTGASATSNYVLDTNAIRKGLAKFSNPMECQRQFQALSSKLRELNDINEHREKKIDGLQEQLKRALDKGVGYATVVQYLARKLKLGADVDLEKECQQLESRVDELMVKDREHESRLESIVSDYKSHLQIEQDLRETLRTELKDAKLAHSTELLELKESHQVELNDLNEQHSKTKSDLESRVEILETDLSARTKELTELRKEYDCLLSSFNKLEDSLTKDKDARVKYAQEKANQLQKDVESLNSVLEMRTERIHALERDSILLGEVQQELTTSHDMNKALKQQIESLTAALENKRVQYENLLVEHEKIANDLKRERKERRRMTMRTEQLEYVLNESCANENNITVLDSSTIGS